jgi:hypothetical protein
MTTITVPQGLTNELLDLAGITPIVIEDTDEVTYEVGGEAGFTLDEALVLALHFIADHAEIS